MPGGRLTDQDRRQIAESLANGLTYTEIGALLGRPISTISREVARNGGTNGYRADQAQQATQSRARRSMATRRSVSSVSRDVHGRDPEAVLALEEQFTTLVIQTGLSRMTARVLTCLYMADSGSLTAAELVDRLQVSAASISKAVGELEQQELIRRERDPRRRRDRYVIDADVWFRGLVASAQQNVALAGGARQGAQVLGVDTPAGARMQDIGQFFEYIGQAMLEAAERWQNSTS